MSWDSAAPLLIVIGVILTFPSTMWKAKWTQRGAVAAVAYLVLTYLHWRLFETVIPVEGSTAQVTVVWAIFLIEAFTWLDAAILFTFLLNRTDRSSEADAYEARLRATRADLPAVDIFIATYNEPADVLDRTITGALSLDWPRDKLRIWVLDDGRRDWLRDEATLRGVGYLTRPDNKGAKAGNINDALKNTDAPFILVLDADFVPQQQFLMRMMGFFEDPSIGIVQAPHCFFNPDPMQTALGMDKVMPDDQRFFFEEIMPGRDGYDCAFCCGSNGIIRRSAIEEIGGAMPEGSITEDMLLTLALKRKGYVTRYLNERLAFGLAPEGIGAFFVQRARWARGGIQIMFLKEGPFGRSGLTLLERLMFLPTHWITQSLGQTVAMATPAFFLLTGLMPLVNTTPDEILLHQIPAIVATIAAVRMFAPGAYHPLATLALSTLQAFRLLPVVLATLIKPHGHGFKVTPKGGGANVEQDAFTVNATLGLAGLTSAGLLINAIPQVQVVPFSHLIPIVTFWAILNTAILLLVARIATSPPARRTEERFIIRRPMTIVTERWSAEVQCENLSLTGALVHSDGPLGLAPGEWIGIDIPDVGIVPARIARMVGDTGIGIAFEIASLDARRAPISSVQATDDPHTTSGALRYEKVNHAFQVLNREGLRASISTDAEMVPGSPGLIHLDGHMVPFRAASTSLLDGKIVTGIVLDPVDGDPRERLVRKLFTEGRSNSAVSHHDAWTIFWRILRGIVAKDPITSVAPPQKHREKRIQPDWLLDKIQSERSAAAALETALSVRAA